MAGIAHQALTTPDEAVSSLVGSCMYLDEPSIYFSPHLSGSCGHYSAFLNVFKTQQHACKSSGCQAEESFISGKHWTASVFIPNSGHAPSEPWQRCRVQPLKNPPKACQLILATTLCHAEQQIRGTTTPPQGCIKNGFLRGFTRTPELTSEIQTSISHGKHSCPAWQASRFQQSL